MIVPVVERSNFVRRLSALKLQLANSERWLWAILAISFIWPWLNTWFWLKFMRTLFRDWLGSNRAWMDVFHPCFVIGLCVWPILLLLAFWVTLKHREQGRHYPVFLLVFSVAQFVVLSGGFTTGKLHLG